MVARGRLVLLAGLLAACGDDADPRALRELGLASSTTCTRTTCAVHVRELPTVRGKILDRRGVPLADNRPERVYPEGDLAAHLLGYMTEMTDAEVERLVPQGYQRSDRVGRYGVERAWENHLRGKPGRELQVIDRRGQVVLDPAVVDEMIDDEPRTEPVPGDTIVLTIDAALQRLAEEAVAAHASAAVAVVAVDTGKLLALVSKPSFDPNVMSGALTAAGAAQLSADPRKPFVDKTLTARYQPSSLFAFVTAIAALEDGLTRPGARISCPGSHTLAGSRFTCTARHGALDLGGAVQRACHVHIWKLAEQVGLDRISEVARNFGFGAATGLGLNGDSPGRVPTKAWYEQRGRFRIGHTLTAAVGGRDVEVSVTQLAMAYAALATGTRHVPQLVERVEGPDGKVKVAFDPEISPGWRAPAPDILALLRRGMVQRSALVDIAGQSATAEVRAVRRTPRDPAPDGWYPDRSHAWFAGWAPADAPEVAIVVLVEHGGAGTDVAAPLARKILEGWWTTVRPHDP